MQLGENEYRRQRIDASEAPQPADWRSVRLTPGDLGQARIQFQQPCYRVIDRQLVVINDRPFGRLRPREAVDPATVRTRPVAAAIMQSTPPQHLSQSMATPLQIFSG